MLSKRLKLEADNVRQMATTCLFDTSSALIKIEILVRAAANQGKFSCEYEGELKPDERTALRVRGFNVMQERSHDEETNLVTYTDKYTISF